MQDTNNKNAPLELGRLIHILSCKMKCQNDCYTILEDSDLTPVQQQLLKFILLESAHKPIFQRDIEEAFQIRRSTVTGIIKLIEQKGYLTRTSVESDARLKQLVPTEKAEALRPRIVEHIKSVRPLCPPVFLMTSSMFAEKFSVRCLIILQLQNVIVLTIKGGII